MINIVIIFTYIKHNVNIYFKRRITQLRMVRQFHRDPASVLLATFLLQFLVLGLNHVANIHDFLTVKLDIFKEQVHLVESVHGSRILQDV